MKKVILMALAAAMICGCEKMVIDDQAEEIVEVEGPTKKFHFTIKGDFGSATFTRGYMHADGKEMTDLWVFDFMDGTCVQSLHQTNEDADWGVPEMSLAYGSHHVYFVASRGVDPSVDTSGKTISWGSVRDTFWKDYEVEVVSTSNGNRAVTLDRVVTKLKIMVDDVVPNGCASVNVTPDRWYYGLNYVTGAAVSSQKKEITVAVPESYAGTEGELIVSVFSLSGIDEWTTNVSFNAKDGSGNIIGSATIPGAPFKRNRSTEYHGSLFGSSGTLDVSINGDWDSPKTGTW